MQSAGPRDNEAQDIAALHALEVLDSGPEAEFDALVRSASLVCGVPMSLISLIDSQRQWFKANVGLPGVTQTPREQAFCAHAVLGDGLFEIADARLDPRFADNPLVTGNPDIRFYAGVPLRLSNGGCVGTLCVIDRQPRELSALQREVLSQLAVAAARALEGRQAARQLQAAMRDSEERLRRQYEATPAMLHTIDAQGRLLVVSDLWLAKLGYTRDEVLGRQSIDFLSPASQAYARSMVRPAFFASGRCDAVPVQMLTRAAEVIDVLVSATLERDDRGRVLRSLVVTEDVTLRRRAERALQDHEAALRKSQEFLDRTGKLAGVGGWELDVASGEVTWSDETRRIHGVAPDYQPVLAEAINFYAPEARPAIQAAVERGMAEGEPWDLELPLIRADGLPFWVRAVGVVEFIDGKPARLAGAVQDITARKRLELQLAAASAEVHDLYDNAPCGYHSLDADGRFLHINATALAWLGCTREALIGKKRATDFFTPEGRAQFQRNFARLKADGQVDALELDLVPMQGPMRRVSINATAVKDAAGSFSMSRTVMFDITERSAAERALRELTAIFDNTTDFVVLTDRGGRITYMNPSVRRATGIAAGAPVTHLDYQRFNTPATIRLYADVVMPALRAGAPAWVGEAAVCLADGREAPVSLMVLAHRDSCGRIERFSAVMRDISIDVHAKRELLRQTATLSSVAEAIPATVAVVGLDGSYRFVNGAFERWWGLPRERILGRQAKDVLGEREFERRWPWAARALAGEAVNFVLDHPSRDGATHVALSYVPLRLGSGEVEGCVVVTQDITHQKREELRLLQLTRRDPLTGLLNRAGFEQHLDRALAERATLALLYIDLDHFKPVNDQHGHAAGDQILQIFAKRLTNLVRPTDAVARLGGDEFAIALTGAGERSNAQAVGEKVLAAAHAPFLVGALRIQVGASIGIAFDADRDSGWQDLVDRADAQLLAAKAAGKGRQIGALR